MGGYDQVVWFLYIWMPTTAAAPLYQLNSWLIYPLGKSIIVLIGESLTTSTYGDYLKLNPELFNR